MRPYTTDEYNTLPHVIMTSDAIWDPRIYDSDSNTQSFPDLSYRRHSDYDLQGQHIGSAHISIDEDKQSLEDFVSGEIFEDAIMNESPADDVDDPFWVDTVAFDHSEIVNRCMLSASNHDIQPGLSRLHQAAPQDFKRLQRFFTWIPTRLIKHTFENSTQLGYMPNSPDGNQFVRWHAPNPALNVF